MSTNFCQCPVCGDGRLHDRLMTEVVEHKQQSEKIQMAYSECDVCGSDIVTDIQLKENRRAVNSFKRSVDGLLSGDNIAHLRGRWRITQRDAAKIFGGGQVAFSKYEAGEINQSEAMDNLLRVSAAIPEAFEWLAHNARIAIPAQSEHLRIRKEELDSYIAIGIISPEPHLHDYHLNALTSTLKNWKKVPETELLRISTTGISPFINESIDHSIFSHEQTATLKPQVKFYGKKETPSQRSKKHSEKRDVWLTI